MLLTLRAVADPAITFATPGLTVAISVSYDLDGEDDLTPPNLALLEELAASDSVDITIHGTRPLEGRLATLVTKASTETIRFSLADAGEDSGQPVKDEPDPAGADQTGAAPAGADAPAADSADAAGGATADADATQPVADQR